MLYRRTLLFTLLYIPVYICLSKTPNSPLLPHPSYPGNHQSIFYVPDLFLFHRQVHLRYILDSTSKWYHVVFVFLFLTDSTYDNLRLLLCCCKWHYFSFGMAEEYSIVYMPHIFILSPADGHLGCFSCSGYCE